MGYGRVASSESLPSLSDLQLQASRDASRARRRVFLCLGLVAVLLLVTSGFSVAIFVRRRESDEATTAPARRRTPSQTLSRACGLTRYPALCLRSLLDFPGALGAARERDLVHVSLNMTLHRVSAAIYGASAIAGAAMDGLSRSAYEDCMELLDHSQEQLSNSLLAVAPVGVSPQSRARVKGFSDEDVVTWLSAALTNQDTCDEGLQQVTDLRVKRHMKSQTKDLTELVSNCLAIFSSFGRNKDFAGIPIHDKRRRKLLEFPSWVRKKDRRLLQAPASSIQADMVVSKDGNGSYTSIADAVKAAPEYSTRRIIIYIKAGQYDENIKVGRKKTNLMFIGDGKSKTIIAGSRSVTDNFTTFHTATFAATGTGFIMRDITVQNWAGPEKHQAVALRVGADHAVVYRCNVIGYQDTLYVHSQRQFFRECDVYGTVDFIFGNAAVVLQNCSLWARRPMPMQKNTITAQNRKDPNQNTGISIHACRVVAATDLEPVKANYSTYLGRPWKLYSRTVFMMSYMEDHIHPVGWLEWNATFALDTLYYGEYMNYGPGAAVGKRVQWPGYRVITLPAEASKFTVAQFIFGSSWLPSTAHRRRLLGRLVRVKNQNQCLPLQIYFLLDSIPFVL